MGNLTLYKNTKANAEFYGWAMVPEYCEGDPTSEYVIHDCLKGTFTYTNKHQDAVTFTVTRKDAEYILACVTNTVPIGGGSKALTILRNACSQLTDIDVHSRQREASDNFIMVMQMFLEEHSEEGQKLSEQLETIRKFGI